MTWALVIDASVVEITDTDPAGRFHPSLTWIPVPSGVPVVAGWTFANGAFAAPPPPPPPTPAQQAQALLANGLHVTSTSTPAINGWYAVDDSHRANIVAIETSLAAGRGFPKLKPDDDGTTMNYPDLSYFFHTFTADTFTNFAAAVRDFYYACMAYGSGASEPLPSAEVTIS